MGVLDPATLSTRLNAFNKATLSVNYLSGPPYEPLLVLPEIDVGRTLALAQGGERIGVNNHVLDADALRRAKVLLSPPPELDFERVTIVDGVRHDEHMGDVMGSMTGKANPPDRRLRSVSPPYPIEWIRANLPEGRVDVVIPRTLGDFQRAVADARPDLLLLSGLNVNTRTLLEMAVIARNLGVKEVWLGGDAALGPYKIVDEMFDRLIWGPGEAYLHEQLVGGKFHYRHPPAERMLANVSWVFEGEGGVIERKEYQSLHLSLRLGCTQSCDYCAEGVKSQHGQAQPVTSLEEAKAIIDRAYDMGIRRVYLIDPDFGRLWKDDLEGEFLKYLASKRMKWSCITNVVTMRRHGDFMVDHGLQAIYLGIESLAPSHRGKGAASGQRRLAVLDRAWQDQTETIDLIQKFTKRGVMIYGLYILFNPGETEKDVGAGVEELRKHIALAQISTNQPFPGTEEFAQAVKSGLVFDLNPDNVRYGRMVWAPEGKVFDPEMVAKTYIKAHQDVNDLRRPGGFFFTPA